MRLDRTQRGRLAKAGQEFLVEHFEKLDAPAQDNLLRQLESLDLDLVTALRAGDGLAHPPQGVWEPLPAVEPEQRGRHTRAASLGAAELKAGRVAFALLAGGQASRLRWDGPKGTYPVGPATERCLFRILVEHVLRAHRDYRRRLPLAVTTSATTDAAIRAYFELNDCFGLDRQALSFACQGSLPALDEEGRLMLSAPDRIFTSPDGHGGALQALETQGILGYWEKRGVRTVCTFQVDNPLLQVVDPDFLGRLWERDLPIATKVIEKRRPSEKLGVVLRVGGRPAIVEYSELSKARAAARDADGRLRWRHGSIAVHAFRLDFLRETLTSGLPLHTARKEIPAADGTRRWGIKYERFVFDLFRRAGDVAVVETVREREYEPLKNAQGKESPATVRVALDREYRRWYREAGLEPPPGVLELSPLEVLGPDDLRPGA